MAQFTTLTSRVLPLPVNDIDTDQIIPARFLKATDKKGMGDNLFADWRYNADGSPKADFVLNQPNAQGAQILLAGDNFGCGSSREHAPWALEDYGFRVILAPSFADIFYNNCFKNGMLPIKLDEAVIDDLFARIAAHPGYTLTVDLEKGTITDTFGLGLTFEIDAFRRHCLLNGLDDIGLTLEHEAKIAAYEKTHAA
jgi:3-isopropylmalate/(R)-2-methylmalate dehydratase small subunit